jgi:GT2 family glycosyltransferase
MGSQERHTAEWGTGSHQDAAPSLTTWRGIVVGDAEKAGLPPRVTVVVPAYNSAKVLGACLRSLFAQTYPLDRYAIIVVDDGSADDTAAVACGLATGWDGQLTVVRKANGGPASARNAGIAATDDAVDVIAFLDADCVAEPTWLEALVSCLAATRAAGVGGPLVNVFAPDWVSRYLDAAQFYRHRMRRDGTVDYLVTANVAFRRAALLAVEGFSQCEGAWGEDADLSFRLIQSGYTLLLAQQGIVTHYGVPTSLGGFVKELYRYGYGNGVLSRAWPRGRQPDAELLRHMGAVVLAPRLALRLRYARRAGWLRALSFCPLIAIEHTSFCVGLVHAVVGGARRRNARIPQVGTVSGAARGS